MDKSNLNRIEDTFLFNRNPIIDKFDNYSKNKSFYKEINKYGYKLFSLSTSTINLFKKYGPENIPKNLKKYGMETAAVVKDVNFSSNKRSKPNSFSRRKKAKELSYDETRKAATFFRIEYIKDQMKDEDLYDLVISATKDIKVIGDLNKWFDSDISNKSDTDSNYLFITLNFLMSIPFEPLVKGKDGIQGFHTDYHIFKKLNEDGSQNEYYEKNYPLSVIIALQDNSYFRFLSNSHNQYDDNGKPNAAEYNCKILELSIGQLIIFHPNLIHSGNNICDIYIYHKYEILYISLK